MTSPSVVLRYRADDDPGQPTTAVVEVIDESLRTYTHLPVDAGRTVVSLPRPGRYLARGWTPAGRPIGAEWHTEDEDEVVIVPAAPAPRPPERGQAVRWVSLWYRTDTRWIPMTGMGEPGSAGWTDLPVPAGAPVAVQLGDDDGPTSTVLTMSDEDVIVSTVTAGSGQPAIAGDDLAAALLGYLHQGDLRSAAVLATRRTGQTAIRAGIAEVALAYVRFLTAADVGSLPVGELVRRLPRSPDAHVLAAWQELRSPEPDSRTARAALLRAHKLGGPVVAAGVRLLADGLALLSRDGRGLPNRPAAAALAQVRRYQRVLCDAALTTYSSLTPNVPACVVSAPVPAHELQWHRVPIGGGHHGEAEFPQYPGEIRSPLSPGSVRAVQAAERRAGELGTGPRRSANQETKVRRQVFAALDSVGAGPEAYGRAGEAAGWLAHSARSLPWAEGAWLTGAGLIVTRQFGDTVEVQGQADGVVRLRCLQGGNTVDLLVPLITMAGTGRELERRIRLRSAGIDRVTGAAMTGLDELTERDLPLIRESVRRGDAVARASWRALIRLYPPGGPIAEAVLDGLV